MEPVPWLLRVSRHWAVAAETGVVAVQMGGTPWKCPYHVISNGEPKGRGREVSEQFPSFQPEQRGGQWQCFWREETELSWGHGELGLSWGHPGRGVGGSRVPGLVLGGEDRRAKGQNGGQMGEWALLLWPRGLEAAPQGS